MIADLCRAANLTVRSIAPLAGGRYEVRVDAVRVDPHTVVKRLYAAGAGTVRGVTWERDGSGMDTVWVRVK
jgi:hypothetical protein